MASDPPEEALHFRGKTLTPESPRPLHIAEPSNIPLLQNQMDAAYHDTSAFESIPDVKEHTLNPALVVQGLQPVDEFSTQAYSLLQSGLEQMKTSSGAAGPSAITGSFPGSNTKAEGIISENESIFTSTTRDEILTSSLSSPVPDPNPDPASHININTAAPAEEDSSAAAQLGSNHVIGRSDALDLYQAASGPALPSYDYQQPQLCTEPEAIGYSLGVGAATTAHNSGDINPDISQTSPLNTAVTYRSLLESNAPSSFTTTTTAAHPAEPINQVPTHNLGDIPSIPDLSLPYPSTLPPRPPVHNYEAIPPSQTDTGSGHLFESSYNPSSKETSQDGQSNSHPQSGYPPVMNTTMSAAPPATAASQQAPSKSHSRKVSGSSRKRDSYDENIESKRGDQQDDTPWGPEIQKKYDDFLRDERVYVTEAHWDRFPVGSRLFIGNLPTERVTKRDLFHLFHMHGKLAQISIKQAYGFIQFLELDSCRKALQAQQGATILKYRSHNEALATLAQPNLEDVICEGQGHRNMRETENQLVAVALQPTEKKTSIGTVTEPLDPPLPVAHVEIRITPGNEALTDMTAVIGDGRGRPVHGMRATVVLAQGTKGMTANLTYQSQEGIRVTSLRSRSLFWKMQIMNSFIALRTLSGTAASDVMY
ncbi:uncharacterized protein GIQ15_00481 [Arthroderma uncinatum]|uniref:uncharacterized protein n=1 Tax=Arthroderma uncinatum TaxID=74035 RepID=UPI00144AB097|nr:uncharacterized protein GIQ15_00481 [Arthroderma uncinatum]KAF3490964.1 hypothetical protein GIQ15_00481 [Arthroderma uncinatum]